MEQLTNCSLFGGITEEECRTMRHCFGVTEQIYRPEEQAYDFGDGRHMIGIVESGSARIERIDRRGNRTILEHLHPGSVFGEMLMFENVAGDSVTVVCDTRCSICFMPEEALKRRCENACDHHSKLVENMFALVTDRATSLSERVEVLSRRSIREKLLCYFNIEAAGHPDHSFRLPFSLSALADYISTDRSAMMRELKKMRDEALVEVDGRQITLSI